MVSKTGSAEIITSHYLFALGIYRFFYILNWAYRYHMEGFVDWISIAAGVVQTVLYCDFFYLYITKGKTRRKARRSGRTACSRLVIRRKGPGITESI